MKFIVDASVAVKWLIRERDSQEAAALLDSELAAPDFIHLEIANVLWKTGKRHELGSVPPSNLLALLDTTPWQLHETLPLAPAALDLAIKLGHVVYDCVYLALAIQIGAPIVTADQHFVRLLRAHGHSAGVFGLTLAAMLVRTEA